jgi:predicted PurR-regulated permease PerM
MIVFLVLRIPFGLLFGLVIGIASVIPFGGVLTVLTISSLLALQNFWLGVEILAVSLIIGQINENIFVPRLVGSATGLNPAVVFISLLIGAKLGGVLGVVLVIPSVSFIKRTADSLRNTDTSLLTLSEVVTKAQAPSN